MDQDFEREPEELSGVIESIKYSNEENGYAILRLRDSDDRLQTLTGCVPLPAAGETVLAYGTWIEHPEYGRQFKAEFVNRILPNTEEGIFEYLSSGIIKGIGPATALLIVNEFGEKSLETIEKYPEELAKINGISLSKARTFSELYRQISVMRRLIEFLCSYGIRALPAVRLYKYYGADALELLNDNPYILCTSHIGGNFREADMLALNLGLSPDSKERIKAAAVFELKYNLGNGHCFIPEQMLIDATSNLISIDESKVREAIEELTADGSIVREKLNGYSACYLPELYDAEVEIAEKVAAMSISTVGIQIDISEILNMVELHTGIEYSTKQKSTLELALNNRLLVITGGPGTGKTTTVKALLEMYDCIGWKYMLAAPTGRAAKRLNEVTGREASTIHRMLGAQYSEDGEKLVFKKNEEDRLECKVLIVDECSMIDIVLMNALFNALPDDAFLVLVGDADQLPPVGPGNCFRSFIESGVVNTVRLNEIFRQSENSAIVKNAHLINDGKYPDFGKNGGDFFRLKRLASADSVETVTELCSKRLPEKMGILPEEIQVLSPTRKGELGTVNLNKYLQDVLNPKDADKPEKSYGDIIFRPGDRVMQIRNNYDIQWHSSDMSTFGTGVFNGDIGYIISMDRLNETIAVDFDGRIAEYSFELLCELEHAWAVTVHKSQGCEFRVVIFVLSGSSKLLLTRTVLYTGITRARELLILIGEDNTAYRMIDNYKQNKRFSFLKLRIKTLCGAVQ